MQEALHSLHRRNKQLEGSALAEQAEQLRLTNGELNRALEAKNQQVSECHHEVQRLETYLARLVRVHATAEGANGASHTAVSAEEYRQLERDHAQLHSRFKTMMAAHDRLRGDHEALRASVRWQRGATPRCA